MVGALVAESAGAQADEGEARAGEVVDAQHQPAAVEAPAAEGEANALVDEGIELRIQERHAEALDRFRRAAKLAPDSVRVRGHLALALHAVGEWIEAERTMERVLAFPEDDWVARHSTELRESLTAVRTHLAWLQVDAPRQGRVLLGGDVLTTLPMKVPHRVLAQRHTLDIELAGRTIHKEIDLASGQYLLVKVVEDNRASPLPVTPPSAKAAPERAERLVSTKGSRRGTRNLGFVMLGVGAAGVTTGVALGVYALAVKPEACAGPECSLQGIQTDARGRQAAELSNLLIAAGVGGGVLGGILLLRPVQQRRGRQASVDLIPGPPTAMRFVARW